MNIGKTLNFSSNFVRLFQSNFVPLNVPCLSSSILFYFFLFGKRVFVFILKRRKLILSYFNLIVHFKLSHGKEKFFCWFCCVRFLLKWESPTSFTFKHWAEAWRWTLGWLERWSVKSCTCRKILPAFPCTRPLHFHYMIKDRRGMWASLKTECM